MFLPVAWDVAVSYFVANRMEAMNVWQDNDWQSYMQALP
jgi:hypothetical protein